MRGRILGFDYRTGNGEISGEDGRRYQFSDREWKVGTAPRAGQSIDFDSSSGEARSIYPLVPSGGIGGDRNKIVAAVLAFFLGIFGVHKFYLGKNTAGVIMLLCTIPGFILFFLPTLVISVIAFIEFIIYLVISEEEFEARYVTGDRAWF